MSGTAPLHGSTGDNEFGGTDPPAWSSSTAGNQANKASGICTFLDGAAAEVMLNGDAQWPSKPAQAGLLVQGHDPGAAKIDYIIDRRDAGNGDAICLRLDNDGKPFIVIDTATLVNPIINEASATEVAAGSVIASGTKFNYFVRVVEVAGAGGGYTITLWRGAWSNGQTLDQIKAGMVLVSTFDIFTAAARVMRDSAGSTGRGIYRRAGGAGASTVFDGLHWGTFS
jgi:hypothetical protein